MKRKDACDEVEGRISEPEILSVSVSGLRPIAGERTQDFACKARWAKFDGALKRSIDRRKPGSESFGRLAHEKAVAADALGARAGACYGR
jgi:hypothetical protein